jgi:putative peptide maturation system protein
MNAVHEALVETVEYLMTLADDGSRPRDARARLRLLQEQYPEVRMDLLWEEEPFDASVHYDVLLSLSTVRTVSVGLSPDRALPWPLRGVHRWSEQNLVRVNHTALEVGQAIACLDFIWDEAPIIDRLVDLCLIQEALERDPITLSDAELQEAMDGFRRAKRLYTAAATYHWLESHGMTQQKLEEYVGDQAIVAKLRRRVAAGRVDTYFAAHHADFDTARIARIDFATEADRRRRRADSHRHAGLLRRRRAVPADGGVPGPTGAGDVCRPPARNRAC